MVNWMTRVYYCDEEFSGILRKIIVLSSLKSLLLETEIKVISLITLQLNLFIPK